MTKDDAMVRHLKSIDDSLKELVRLSKPQNVEVTFGDGKPLVEDNPTKVRTVKRLTEPGEPVTGGEGEYLLNPEADTSGN